MIKNPYINALLAAAYVAGIASFLYYAPHYALDEQNVLIPIMMLSLFVLSAAVMGFLFLAAALGLYFKGEREEAVRFFGKTVGAFALLTFIFVALVFAGA